MVTTSEQAWSAAAAIGGPVVVKPRSGNQGKGVTSNVSTEAEVVAAFEAARQRESDVLVEAFIPGDDHRLLVVGGCVVAAARRDPPSVVGDGTLCISELVARVNADPRRGIGHGTPLTRIPLDEIALSHLQSQGWRADDVPPRGTRVTLRHNANLSTGGSATDVTDEIHPEVAARAIEAARMVGLDICGVDVICRTVREPLERQNGAIVEVNAAPGLRMHLQPSHGRARNVGDAIVGTVFPPDEDGRIPVVAVTGVNGKTTTVRLTAAMFATSGLRVGMTTTDGVFVDARQIDRGDCSGPRSARSVLFHPDVDAAVLETARGGILREGLGFDYCSVAVVTNIGTGDHLGLDHIDRPEDLAAVKQVVVRNTAPRGAAVLNAADPLVASMAQVCPGEVILFAADPMLPGMVEHRARGRRSVHVADGEVVAVAGHAVQWSMSLCTMPVTRGGILGFQVQNVLAATAAAWAAGLSWAAIEGTLARFDTTASSVPGRFNEFHVGGGTVFADYGHNPDALAALVQGLDGMPASRRSIVISAAGDRRDEDIVTQGRIVGAAFDRVLLYQDAAQRGRGDGEVMALLRKGLQGGSRVTEIEEIRGEFVAIDRALDQIVPGEICLILIDQVEEALEHLASRASQHVL